MTIMLHTHVRVNVNSAVKMNSRVKTVRLWPLSHLHRGHVVGYKLPMLTG